MEFIKYNLIVFTQQNGEQEYSLLVIVWLVFALDVNRIAF